jgi:hypothetical protein
MPIGRDPGRRHTRHCPFEVEERLSGGEVPCIAEPHIDQVSVLINGMVEILPLPLDFHIRTLMTGWIT